MFPTIKVDFATEFKALLSERIETSPNLVA